jgi:hypothetical protein
MLSGRLLYGVGAFLVVSVLLPQRREQNVPPPPPEPVKVKILVAKTHMDIFTTIKNPRNLFVEKWVAAEDAPRDAISDARVLRGKVLKNSLRKGDDVRLDDLGDERDRPLDPRVPRWEYCEFSKVGDRYRVEAGEQVYEARDLVKLSEKLGRPTRLNHVTAILNILGAEGWELVSHQYHGDGAARRHYWTFKRPLPLEAR